MVQHMRSTCHWLPGEGAAKEETLLSPSNAVLFKGGKSPLGDKGERKIVNGNEYSQKVTDLG